MKSVKWNAFPTKALDSPNIVIGTITFGGDDFILGIKNREDVEISEVTPDNRDSLPDQILRKISDILSSPVL
jgi:nucleoside-triphosphatase THEP1